jgi:putative N-acetyltransferase (TIGR04045 family)
MNHAAATATATAAAVIATASSTAIATIAALHQATTRVKIATGAAERAAARRLRHSVFCAEQGLFDGDDIDAIDAIAIAIIAITSAPGLPDDIVGTVRIHQAENDIWWGSRLAVKRAARRQANVGSALIRLAVGSASALGCQTFLAHVQARNVPMFEQLHWHSLDIVELHGRTHHLMRADLAHYPAIVDGTTGFLCSKDAR